MQTPKSRQSFSSGALPRVSPRSGSSEVSAKDSPQAAAASDVLPKKSRVVRQLKTSPRYSDPTASSSKLATRAPKERSPKVADNRSPKTPTSEKKRPGRVSELESQISQLENDLKKAKDQLCSSEASEKQALKDAEQANQQLTALSTKLAEARESKERDQTLHHDAATDPKQHSQGSEALASALNEVELLKLQLEVVAESEATQIKQSESAQGELHKLKQKLEETRKLAEDMKNQLLNCKESEAQAQGVVKETLLQLETAKKMVETLRSDGCKATEAYGAVASELEQSRAHVNFLEQLVNKLKADMEAGVRGGSRNEEGDGKQESEEDSLEKTKVNVNSLNLEIEQLQSTMADSEIRYGEEQARNVEELKNALEMVERIKYASGQREDELKAQLQKSKDEIQELKANLMDKETELQGICEENETLALKLGNMLSGQRESELEDELRKLKAETENLKASLMDKETEWQSVLEENETLKSKIKDSSKGKISDEIVSDLEAARASEREALMKVGYMTEEVDKSNRKAARMLEQLEAAQAVNAEMEAELRKVKVQSDQWRKAAEAAAAMLSAGNGNGQLMERTGSMDSNCSPRIGRMGSPFGDDFGEDLLKKKNANMLKRLGVLWKKPQK